MRGTGFRAKSDTSLFCASAAQAAPEKSRVGTASKTQTKQVCHQVACVWDNQVCAFPLPRNPLPASPISPVSRCELPVKRAAGAFASNAKKSASLPVAPAEARTRLSWPKARIDIHGGGQTGWTKKINATRCDGRKPAERQNRKPSAPSDRHRPAQAKTGPGPKARTTPKGARLSLPKHGNPGARPSPRGLG